MKHHKLLKRIFSLSLVLLMMLSGASPAFAALKPKKQHRNTRISIATEADFLAFADSCRLDAFSEGITVTLENDISLSAAIAPVPIFSGTFQGNGHAIRGLNITGKYARAGLFGVLTETALVEGLTVEGTVSPKGSVETAGGIAGSNSGSIRDCTFQGRVHAESGAGGIAGSNSGEISHCTAGGSVTALKSAGGIAGENTGELHDCSSGVDVNKNISDRKTRLRDYLGTLSSDLPLTEKVSVLLRESRIHCGENIGGVAGRNDGIIMNCASSGSVGREADGYNVGGIAGRSSGFIFESSNTGTVSGRENVGGICGLSEPNVEIIGSGDLLENVREEVDSMLELIEQFTYDIDDCTDDVTARIGDLSDSLGDVSISLADFERELSYLINVKIAELNALKNYAGDVAKEVSGIGDEIQHVTEDSTIAIRYITAAVEAFSPDARMAIMDDRLNPNGEFVSAESPLYEDIRQDWIVHYGISETDPEGNPRPKAEVDTEMAFRHLQQSGAQVNAVLHDVNAISDAVVKAIAALSEIGKMSDISGITESFNRGFANVMYAMNNTMESVKQLGNSVGTMEKVVSSTIRAVTGEIGAIANGVFDSVYDITNGFSIKNYYYSSEAYKDGIISGDGVISCCSNEANVRGTRAVGGIVGAQMTDGVPKIISTGKLGVALASFCYTNLVEQCQSSGNVVADEDYAGLITGMLKTGTVHASTGYGTAQSRRGSNVGGIAGYSRGSIESCFAKGRLSGREYIGGIAGGGAPANGITNGSIIRNCVSQVIIDGDSQFRGGISGSEDGSFEENYFIGQELNGIVAYSLAGKAENLSEEELPDLDDLPADFQSRSIAEKAAMKSVRGISPAVLQKLGNWAAALAASAVLILCIWLLKKRAGKKKAGTTP